MTMNKDAPKVAIPLSRKKKRAVELGSVCLMLSIAMIGFSLNVLQGPILSQMDAMNYFSLLSIFASLGLAIMTPLGGKLGDLFGRRNIVLISGTIATICGVGLGLVNSIIPFMFFRLVLGAAQGAFTAAPYIIAREINEPTQVPKAMGILSSSIAIGGFLGSIIAGWLTDMGQLKLAIVFPVIPLILGVILIGFNLPNMARKDKVVIDYPGMALVALLLSAFLLSMNYGARIGWTNPFILMGFLATIVAGYLLIKVEKSAQEPVIPLHLFKNKHYNILLLVSFIAYYYQAAMNIYTPLAAQSILKASTTLSGTLQLPRTVLVMALPAFLGIWVGKKTENYWKAMAIAMVTIILCFIPLSFTTATTSIFLYMGAIALTGISESYRAVSITPAAQATLAVQDLGIGTALVTFVNSLASLFSSAVSGVLLDINQDSLVKGINSIYISIVLVSLVGLALVLIFIRKSMSPSSQ